MSIQPKYRWTFKNISNSVATDIVSGATARLSNVTPSGQGRIGNAVALNGTDNSYISLGSQIGQFGRADFTIAFGVKIAPITSTSWIELLGDRKRTGHNNFFCIRVAPEGRVSVEVDEDINGTNYIWLYNNSSNPSGLDNDTWHHIVVVRQQRTLKLYIDGSLVATGTANGITNIANGNELIMGNPNPGVNDSAIAPKAEFEDLRIYDRALSDQQVAEVFLLQYRWTFKNINNSIATDIVSGATARLSNVTSSGQGRIGNAVALNGSDDSYISLGSQIGQFGTKDFTVAFGVKIAPTEQLIELLGNRMSASHGNFFCIRVTPEGKVSAEVDESSNGTNYVLLYSSPDLDDGCWHHIVVVRQQRTLKLYIDGSLVATGTANGITNIANGNELIMGNPNPGVNDSAIAPKAEFEDLRIYDRALSDQQVAELVQRVSILIPSLRQGEVELKTASGFSRTWATDVTDLSRFADFEKLRLGPNTGVTLYKDPNFNGWSQEVAADLPRLSDTKLGASPKSVKIWSTVGRPFTGKWAILAPNGQYFSCTYFPREQRMITIPCVSVRHEAFGFSPRAPQPASPIENFDRYFTAGRTFISEQESGLYRFSLLNSTRDRWLKLVPSNLVVLKAMSGKYIGPADVHQKSTVIAKTHYSSFYESFELIQLENDQVCLRTGEPNDEFSDGFYLHVRNDDGNKKVVTDRNYDSQDWMPRNQKKELRDARKFKLEKLEGNKVALRPWQDFTRGIESYVSVSDNPYEINSIRFFDTGGGSGWGTPLIIRTGQRGKQETFEQINLGMLDWTANKDERAIFTGAIRIADNEAQVGELLPGDAAFYTEPAYWGKAWVFYSSCSDFRLIEGLNDSVSSVRLGPQTGATLYSDVDYGADSQDRKNDITDIVENIPAFSEDAQVGNENLSSAKFWSNIPPKQANVYFSISLSQDYKLDGAELKEFTSYRTILKFPPEVTKVEVWATDLTEIEVDDKPHEVDEDRSVELSPNGMNRLMITVAAGGINTPGLKIRTNTMQHHERVVIFPDREVHDQLANLGDGALWEAKDAQGNFLVARSYDAAHVADVQRTITKTMKTVNYVAAEGEDRNQIVDREVSTDAINQPWGLNFSVPANARIQVQEQKLSQNQFDQLVAQASGSLGQGLGSLFRKIKTAVSKAVSIAVGVVKKIVDFAEQAASTIGRAVEKAVAVVLTTVENTVRKVETFVIDTAEKAGAFVEGVVEKIGVEAKKLVEYLRALFNWGDILSTQRYLADAIDTGLDYVVKLVAAARDPVNDFIAALRRGVNDGLDQTINDLRRDSQSVSDQPQLSEKLEWLLSKLTSNSSKLATEASNLSQPQRSSDPLDSFFSAFKSASKEVVDIVLDGLEGLGATIATLILKPTQPQLALIAILEMVKNVTDHAMDFINDIAIGFLDCIQLAVGKFRSLITADINIPFLKGLFKLIGINKLSLLNIATLLIAIPVTITSKLIFGRKPFREPRLAQSIPDDIEGWANNAQDEVGDWASTAIDALSSPNDVQGWAITGFVCDAINGLITGLLDMSAIKHIGFELISKVLSCTSWLGSFPDSPDPDDASKKIAGGRPYGIAKYPVSESSHEAEYWGRVMWSWRTFVFGTNIIAFLVTKAPLKRGSKRELVPTSTQEAVGKAMPVLCTLFAAIDIGISAKYLVSSREVRSKHTEGIRQSAEYVGIFPSILAPLNYWENPYALLALGAIDISCAAVVSGLKGDMLRRGYNTLGQG